MIPKEFTNTYKLEQKLNQLINNEAEMLFQITDPEGYEEHERARAMYEAEGLDEIGQYKIKINENFKSEYEKLNTENVYFLGCSFQNYQKNYDKRLEGFKEKYNDAEEQNFIYEELKEIINFNLPNYIDEDLKKNISYSLERTKEDLTKRLQEKNFEISFSKNNEGLEILSIKNNLEDYSITKIDNSKLEWKVGDTALVELGTALIEAKCVNVGKGELSETKFFELLASFFNISKLYHNKYKGDIKARKKDITVLIPQLNKALEDWVNNS